jgi:hypothetical protein
MDKQVVIMSNRLFFQGLLSCGGWVKDLIDSHPWLRHVVLLGIPEEKLDSIPEGCRDKVKAVTDKQLHRHSAEGTIAPTAVCWNFSSDRGCGIIDCYAVEYNLK